MTKSDWWFITIFT